MRKEIGVKIKISAGFHVFVSKIDYERVAEKTWRLLKSPNRKPRIVHSYRDPATKTVQTISLARFILGPSGKQFAVQIDPDKSFDFRRSNLAFKSPKQRQRSLKKRKVKTSSIYKGVYYCRQQSLWRASIQVGKYTKALGTFRTERAAAQKNDEAAQFYFGTDARLNFG